MAYDASDDPLLACLNGVKAQPKNISSGGILFRQGDAAYGMFRVISGRVRLVRVTPEGTPVTLHTARAGELFAEASLFSANYHCDAVALEPCEVLAYPKQSLCQHLRDEPDAMWAFTELLARQVQGLRTRLELRQIRAAPERILQFLRLRCDADGKWQPQGTWRQFAEEIGLTHEALYRALAALEKTGRITRSAGGVRLDR